MKKEELVFVDIDGVLCKNTWGNYENAAPIKKNIKLINKIYEDGNTIIIWTSRGTLTGIDWCDLTKKQLSDWKVEYHELRFNKPYYDFFIEDRAGSIDDYLRRKKCTQK